jgi:nucleotide-binding universal stress UspA family protein
VFKHVLLPTDGSTLSERAARDGVRFAKSISAQVTVLHITPLFYPSVVQAYATPASVAREYAARVREHEEFSKENAARALEPIERVASEAGVVCSTVHRVADSPWEVIINVAAERGCDAIFMASHGRRGVSALLIGSETNKVLTHTKIPVIVWRPSS